MSRISVNPNELEGLAADLQKLEDQCDDIKDSLKWNYNLLHATYWDVDSTSAGGLYHSLVQKLEHYQTLMNNAQAVVTRTEAQFREADQGWFNQAKEWGMELVGVNDVVRIFAEYDPVTGEKLDDWDRLQAAGWTALTIFPPAKLAGLGGKAIIKGAKVLKMGDKATEAFRGMMKVLHPDVIKTALNRALSGIKDFPLFPNFNKAMVTHNGQKVFDSVTIGDILQRFSANPKTRLPKTNGRWEGNPGNGKWHSEKPEVLEITNGEPVTFKEGRPDFSQWSKGSLKFKEGILDGSQKDFNIVYEKIKQIKGLKSQSEAKKWLREKGLTPHHFDKNTIQLIPTKLHGNVPHVGAASDMRGGF